MLFTPDFPTMLALVGASIVAYLLSLAVYRLYFHPLAKFPGPRLAAISFAYEFYWDVIQPGLLTDHLPLVHKKYGPIVRITPNEVHILDSPFFDELYTRSGHGRSHKTPRFTSRFASEETFSTGPHDLHKMRRAAINPFFSAGRIIKFQPIIRKNLTQLVQALIRSYKSEAIVPMNLGYMALTGDIMTEYAFARSYNQIDSPGFSGSYDESLKAMLGLSNLNMHFPFIVKIIQATPRWITAMTKPVMLPVVDFFVDRQQEIRDIRTGLNEDHKLVDTPTIFHQMLTTPLLSENDKSDKRLGDEAVSIIAAGIQTTSGVLALGTFHILNNPEILQKLRAELRQHLPDMLNLSNLEVNKSKIEWRALESLHYLTGCIKESIRMSAASQSRSPRILPDKDLKYNDYIIPRGSEISMSISHVSSDPEIFVDPSTFRPDRWIIIDHKTGQQSRNTELERYFVPFSKGTRQCAGMNLAFADLYMTLAVIFRTFEMELYETDVSDVTNKHAYLVGFPKFDTNGVRVRITGLLD